MQTSLKAQRSFPRAHRDSEAEPEIEVQSRDYQALLDNNHQDPSLSWARKAFPKHQELESEKPPQNAFRY